MKIFHYLGSGLAFVLTFSMTSVVLGGGIAGGGGPPSKEILSLLWDQQLEAVMTLTLPSGSYGPIGSSTTLDAINSQGQTRSYRIVDGIEPASLILIDRRLLLREARYSPKPRL